MPTPERQAFLDRQKDLRLRRQACNYRSLVEIASIFATNAEDFGGACFVARRALPHGVVVHSAGAMTDLVAAFEEHGHAPDIWTVVVTTRRSEFLFRDPVDAVFARLILPQADWDFG